MKISINCKILSKTEIAYLFNDSTNRTDLFLNDHDVFNNRMDKKQI
jgi:hypothetical protein